MSVSASEGEARAIENRAAKSGRHTRESAQRFWMRMIAGGSAKSLRGVGSLLALATAGAIAAALVAGLWYFAVGDLLADEGTAATTAVAGAIVIWVFVTGAGTLLILRARNQTKPRSRRRRNSRRSAT